MDVILTIIYSPWSAYSGGAQRSTHNLAKALCRRGHTVTVVFTKPPWEHVEVPGGLPYDVRWAALPAVRSRRAAPLRPLSAFSVARVVRGLLRPGVDTVVHSNAEEGGLIHRLRPRHRFGFVATPRYPHYPQLLLEARRLTLPVKLRLLLTESKYLMQGSAVRHADLCCPPSAFAARLVQRAFQVDEARIRVVPNGVPEEFLHFERAGPVPEGPLVFFGRFDATKGIDTLVDALALLGKEAPPALIIGRSSPRPAVEKHIAALHLQDRVQVRPWMSHAELGELLTQASMVVLPSREENFSLAVLGAMAVGVPVISTRAGGTPEIIQDGQTGLLVEPDRPQALAEAILRLQRDPALAEQIARAGRRHVRQHLTWDAAAERFEALYLSLFTAA